MLDRAAAALPPGFLIVRPRQSQPGYTDTCRGVAGEPLVVHLWGPDGTWVSGAAPPLPPAAPAPFPLPPPFSCPPDQRPLVVSLGVPMGCDALRAQFCMDLVSAHAPQLHRLAAIYADPQLSSTLIRCSANLRMGYMSRTVGPALSAQAASAHDIAIMKAFFGVNSVSPDDPAVGPATFQAGLSLSHGGCGIAPAVASASAGFVASVKAAACLLMDRFGSARLADAFALVITDVAPPQAPSHDTASLAGAYATACSEVVKAAPLASQEFTALIPVGRPQRPRPPPASSVLSPTI